MVPLKTIKWKYMINLVRTFDITVSMMLISKLIITKLNNHNSFPIGHNLVCHFWID